MIFLDKCGEQGVVREGRICRVCGVTHTARVIEEAARGAEVKGDVKVILEVPWPRTEILHQPIISTVLGVGWREQGNRSVRGKLRLRYRDPILGLKGDKRVGVQEETRGRMQNKGVERTAVMMTGIFETNWRESEMRFLGF
jgi:hypothetical protein